MSSGVAYTVSHTHAHIYFVCLRYAKCLRGFYFVHPNALLKTTVWFLSTASFWEKVMFINSLEQLINEYKFDPKMISIPGRIWE